jgi:hypothetical protein
MRSTGVSRAEKILLSEMPAAVVMRRGIFPMTGIEQTGVISMGDALRDMGGR